MLGVATSYIELNFITYVVLMGSWIYTLSFVQITDRFDHER